MTCRSVVITAGAARILKLRPEQLFEMKKRDGMPFGITRKRVGSFVGTSLPAL
jgi:hypothetical protein